MNNLATYYIRIYESASRTTSHLLLFSASISDFLVYLAENLC
jgi:hypothetical protein